MNDQIAGAAIEIRGLTKTFGSVRAVDDLSFTVAPRTVTGFLGPNGAGKTTTLRMLLGLVSADTGTATIGGRPYAELARPNDVVGAALEASGFHPARSGRHHLAIYCRVNGYPLNRADEVLATVGLTSAASRSVGGYSLGMRQRLALAAALLGDPTVLVLDEPANGLDPEGIVWMRSLLRKLAGEGRTVLVSSHVLTEVQQLVDHVVIINHGRLVQQGPLSDLFAQQASVLVRTPHAERLATALTSATGGQIERTSPDTLHVAGMDIAAVGHIAYAERVELHELTTQHSDLEEVFFSLTAAERPSTR
ncbi:ABC transporter ATP-binding protein [Kribbella sancticallisti]|uniref:ABC transporter ATP-binding protein n=1 Tax=Kribbella sancticallisti TaxID=460087 RepID=A0ABN2CJB5_9ACTN